MGAKTRLFTALVVAAALGGCGDSGTNSGGADASSAGGDGGSATDDAGDSNAITLTMTTFTVPAGGEVYKCQNFANPFGGTAEVSGFESHMTPGSHHLLLFYAGNNQDGAIEDCSGLEFHPTPYGAQTPNSVVNYPPGIAAEIPDGQGLRVQAHYLNTSDQDITAVVTVTFHLADPGSVTDHAGMVFMNNPAIYVSPGGSPQDVTASCTVPRNVHLIFANSHMHKHGVEFTAIDQQTGTELYHTNNWDDPPLAALSPAIDLAANTKIQWTCSFLNNTGSALTFGESAETNEMCIFTGQYYPAPASGDPMIGCNTGF